MRKIISRLLQLLVAGDEAGQMRERKAVTVSLSLGLAIVLWVLVTLNKSYEYNLYFPVKIVQVPDSLEVTDQETKTLSLITEGIGVDLFMAYLRSRKDTLELPFRSPFIQDEPVPSSAYFNDIQQSFRSPNIKLSRIIPEQVFVDVDFKIFKKVPLRLTTEIGLKKAYQLEAPPRNLTDSVKLYGAASRLNDIQEWRTLPAMTQPLDRAQTLLLDVDTAADIEVIPAKANIFVQPRLYTETTLDIPIEILDKPDEIEVRLSHPVVKAVCLVPMDEYDALRKEILQKKVKIPFNTLDPEFPYLIPDLKMDKKVKLLYRDPLEISYVIVHTR
ncbi:MAG: hypothetical protein AAFR59_11140 [Bacteroidota bacterium]